jgi:hypothetical protein
VAADPAQLCSIAGLSFDWQQGKVVVSYFNAQNWQFLRKPRLKMWQNRQLQQQCQAAVRPTPA